MCTTWNEMVSCGRHFADRGVRFDECEESKRGRKCHKHKTKEFVGKKKCHCCEKDNMCAIL